MLPKFNVNFFNDIATLYTPARFFRAGDHRQTEALRITSIKDNTIGVVTDGTAVLGLGRAGPYAAVPVMEGKAACSSPGRYRRHPVVYPVPKEP